MHFTKFDSLDTLDEAASEWILNETLANQKTLISAATGNSPTGTYKKLVLKKDRIPLDRLSFLKLDEWYGLPKDDPASCEYYLRRHLLGPLGIHESRFVSFDGKAADPQKECTRVQQWLLENGPIDLCILGIGQNGHIAFNEPDTDLVPGVHLGVLSATSLIHTMISSVDQKLKYGLTLGMTDILMSRRILLIVNGQHKAKVLDRLMEQKISTSFPGSFLWLHPRTDCFYCVQ